MAVRREHDGLVVAGVGHLDLGEDAVQVVARSLGGAGQSRVVERLDARDLGADAVLDALFAEVGSPRPGGDDRLDGGVHREQTHLAVAAKDQRPDVAGLESVARDHREGGVVELVDAVRHGHVVELGGADQALQVFLEAEDSRARGRLVAADTLEHSGAVVKRMGEHVDLGFSPGHELAVHPDLVHLGYRGHRLPPVLTRESRAAASTFTPGQWDLPHPVRRARPRGRRLRPSSSPSGRRPCPSSWCR